MGGWYPDPSGEHQRGGVAWDRRTAVLAAAAATVVLVPAGVLIGRALRPDAPATSIAVAKVAPTPSAAPAVSSLPVPSATAMPTPPPAVTVDPAPPPGYTGQAEVLSARGLGDFETSAFATQGSHLLGDMSAQSPGASFYLVPEGAGFDATMRPTAGCLAPCASGGWSATVPVGRYRLVVRTAAPGVRWSFTVSEQVQPPLTFTTEPAPPPGATGDIPVVRSSGVGDQQSRVFHISAASLLGGMSNRGSGSFFYLVPAGQAFNPDARPTAQCSGNCASGGWSATVSPGDYYLVVRADDGWSFDIDELRH